MNEIKAALIATLMMVAQPSMAAEEYVKQNPTYATINGEIEITKMMLRNYAVVNPYMLTQLGVPGGPMRVLNDMINLRILALEGDRIGHPRHGDMAGGESGFAISVRQRLAPTCDEPDDKMAKEYFNAHLPQFSTPLYLRLNRYGKFSRPENGAETEKILSELADKLRRNETTFLALSPSSDDEISRIRNGDIGFVADSDPKNPVMEKLRNAKLGEVIGPVLQGNMAFLYQLTDRREPIPADFDSVKKEVKIAQRDACTRERTERLFSELRERWKVKMLVSDISVKPGEE